MAVEEIVVNEAAERRHSLFKEELEHIKNDDVRNLAKELLNRLPEYFFIVPASSTGKYHPSYCTGNGGLVRHTKATIRIAVDLLRLEMYANVAGNSDAIILALLLHDGWKHGKLEEDESVSTYSKADHARICSDWLRQQTDICNKEYLDLIANLILTHMGQWNMNNYTGDIFAPKPQTPSQCFVHLCDYLASRKSLEVNFNAPFGI